MSETIHRWITKLVSINTLEERHGLRPLTLCLEIHSLLQRWQRVNASRLAERPLLTHQPVSKLLIMGSLTKLNLIQ